jgi:hypothetical protein
MPFYHQLGKIPHKRHTVFRQENGKRPALLTLPPGEPLQPPPIRLVIEGSLVSMNVFPTAEKSLR